MPLVQINQYLYTQILYQTCQFFKLYFSLFFCISNYIYYMRKRNIKTGQYYLGSGVKINCTSIAQNQKKMFATGDNQNNIIIWLMEAKLQPSITLSNGPIQNNQAEIESLTFSYTEQQIISGTNRGIINVWDLNTSRISNTLKGHSTAVSTLTIFKQQEHRSRLVSGSYDTNIKLWDLRTKNNTCTLKGHNKQIKSIDISPDSSLMISGSEDSTIKLWDLRYPERLLHTYTNHTASVNCIKFNPEQILFASGSSDKTAKYFRCESNQYNYQSTTQLISSPITAIQFDVSGKVLFTAGNDTLKVWNLAKSGVLIQSIQSPWKGVQSICATQNCLNGISYNNNILSIWVYLIQQNYSKLEEKALILPPIYQNRIQELKDLQGNIDKVIGVVNNIERDISKKGIKKNATIQDQSLNQSPVQNEKKKNFLQQLQRKRSVQEKQERRKALEIQKRKEEQLKRREQELLKREQQMRKKQEREKQIKEERQRKLRQQKQRKQRQQKELREMREARERQKRRQQLEKQELGSARLNHQNASRNNQIQKRHLQQQFNQNNQIQLENMEQSINFSDLIGDQQQKQKFRQFDQISQILKGNSKYDSIMNIRKCSLKPILNWWTTNNIKNALYAINQSNSTIVNDAIFAILNSNKLKSNITPESAITLIRKTAQLMSQKQAVYAKNGMVLMNKLVLIYKDEIIKLKNFSPGSKVDLMRQERVAKYDKLIDQFLSVFKMERLIKFSKQDQSQELNQVALILYKNLEEMLRKCVAKNQNEMVAS